jgi:hypothetical protein
MTQKNAYLSILLNAQLRVKVPCVGANLSQEQNCQNGVHFTRVPQSRYSIAFLLFTKVLRSFTQALISITTKMFRQPELDSQDKSKTMGRVKLLCLRRTSAQYTHQESPGVATGLSAFDIGGFGTLYHPAAYSVPLHEAPAVYRVTLPPEASVLPYIGSSRDMVARVFGEHLSGYGNKSLGETSKNLSEEEKSDTVTTLWDPSEMDPILAILLLRQICPNTRSLEAQLRIQENREVHVFLCHSFTHTKI